MILFSAWSASLPPADPTAAIGRLIALVFQLFCTPIATAAITYGVYQQMRGSSPSLVDCLKVGLTTLFPLVGLAFVQSLGIGLASLACLVPGIVLAVRWAVAIPAKVEERASVSDALNRSTYLTEGFRWQVFGVLAVVVALYFGLIVVAVVAFGGKVQSGPYQFTQSMLQVVNTGLTATAAAVMYYRLRSVKESVDVDQISSVFT